MYRNATILFQNLKIKIFCEKNQLTLPVAVLYSLMFASSSGQFNAVSAV